MAAHYNSLRWQRLRAGGSRKDFPSHGREGLANTDTPRDYVYTECDGVKHFVEEFLETLLPEAARDSHSWEGSSILPEDRNPLGEMRSGVKTDHPAMP
jgi:hypothetical protein